MSKLLLSGVAAVALMVAINGPVLAADMMVRKAPPPVPAGCDWCGFYFGGHTGYGSSRSTYLGSDPTGVGNKLSGLAVGLHSVYNWQSGQWVFGIESDATITPWERTYTESGGGFTHGRRRIDWLSSIRGRLGFTFDRNLIYATGGVAWVGANTDSGTSDHNRSVRMNSTGYVVGGGIERKLTQNISVRFEGLHYVFNKTRQDNTSGSDDLIDKLKTVTVIRTGLSWHIPNAF